MFLLFDGKQTRTVSGITAGTDLISCRVGTASHTQSAAHREGCLIAGGGCCKTIRTSTWCFGDRKGGKCRAAHKGGGDIVGDHPPLGRIGEPGECHGASKLRIRGPAGSAVR